MTLCSLLWDGLRYIVFAIFTCFIHLSYSTVIFDFDLLTLRSSVPCSVEVASAAAAAAEASSASSASSGLDGETSESTPLSTTASPPASNSTAMEKGEGDEGESQTRNTKFENNSLSHSQVEKNEQNSQIRIMIVCLLFDIFSSATTATG